MRRKAHFRVPVVDPSRLDSLFIIKGLRELRSKDPIDPDSLKFRVLRKPARLSSLGLVDQAVNRLLAQWGFTDTDWINQFALAILEIATNAAQHGHPGPNSKIQILFQTFNGKRFRYLYAYVSGNGVPIDVRQLKKYVRDPLAVRGRGTGMVRVLSDIYAVIKETDGVIIMKKVRLSRSPSQPARS